MRFPVLIPIRRSVRFVLLLLLAHLVALGSVVLIPWAWQVRTLLAVFVFGSAWKAVSTLDMKALHLLSGDRIEGVFASGVSLRLIVSPRSVVFPQFVLLRFFQAGEPRLKSLVIFPDHVGEGRFHQMRLWLRAQASVTDGASDRAS